MTKEKEDIIENTQGRWPSHLLISHSAACTVEECAVGCPVATLDAQSGELKHGGVIQKHHGGQFNTYGKQYSFTNYGYMDIGGASKYFQAFRPTEEDPSKHAALMRYLLRLITPPGGTVLDLTGNETTAQACSDEGFNAIIMNPSNVEQE